MSNLREWAESKSDEVGLTPEELAAYEEADGIYQTICHHYNELIRLEMDPRRIESLKLLLEELHEDNK